MVTNCTYSMKIVSHTGSWNQMSQMRWYNLYFQLREIVLRSTTMEVEWLFLLSSHLLSLALGCTGWTRTHPQDCSEGSAWVCNWASMVTCAAFSLLIHLWSPHGGGDWICLLCCAAHIEGARIFCCRKWQFRGQLQRKMRPRNLWVWMSNCI